MELGAFLQWSSKLTRRKLLYTDTGGAFLKRKIYLLSPKPVPISGVWSVTRSVLAMHGYGLTRSE